MAWLILFFPLTHSGGTLLDFLQNVSRKEEIFREVRWRSEDRFLRETFCKKSQSVPPLCVTSSGMLRHCFGWRTFICLFFPLIQWIKLIPKTIENRKRDCAWGCARGINTTRENLHIAKHKSGRRSFRSPDWFVICDLQIFSGGVYPPSATSRTLSFSISNNFWY